MFLVFLCRTCFLFEFSSVLSVKVFLRKNRIDAKQNVFNKKGCYIFCAVSKGPIMPQVNANNNIVIETRLSSDDVYKV